MANSTVHVVAENPAASQHPAGATSVATRRLTPLYSHFATAAAIEGGGEKRDGSQAAFLSRFVVLQAVGAAFVAALWIAGLAGKPFEGTTAVLCWIILAMGALGIVAVFLQRWHDAQWLATHVVRIGLLGTVVGLIIAFSAAASGNTSNPEDIKPMIAAVVNGMYVSLYATLLGIGTNLWLKINLRLLGNYHG
jgi:hypothetical protein